MLDFWGHILVLAAGGICIILAIILVLCFIGPNCPGYKCLHSDSDNCDRRQITISPPIGNIMLRHLQNPYESRRSLVTRSSRDSSYSTMSEKTDIENKSQVSCQSLNSKISEDHETTKVQLLFKYALNGEGTSGKFSIKIKDIMNVPHKPYGSSFETYAVVRLLSGNLPLHQKMITSVLEGTTEVLRHTNSPKFNHTFTIEARRLEIKEYLFQIAIFDKDKYSSPTELASLEIPLKEIKDYSRDFSESEISLVMPPSIRDCGRILVGLSYLPTAQRLCLTIVRAQSLKFLYVTDALSNFRPYARIYQLTGTCSRSVKRKKTSVRQGTIGPVFNETFTFSMTRNQLESATMLICICSENKEESNPEPEAKSNGKVERLHLGKVALGKRVRGPGAVMHWNKAMSASRTVISMWHSLY